MEFRILGPLEVLEEGRPVALGGAEAAGAPARLLLLHANEVVSRDRLIDELWGAAPPDTARDGAPGVRLPAAQGARPGSDPDPAPRLPHPGQRR